ncbi:MAG TPA: 50S ribosomal protein L14 [Alphaproteobacteria bacterium]|jgi:large subunit ribosomal protein L14|nr:50S ribosomal protein L14 [Alphaproteobacteria bacterium]
MKALKANMVKGLPVGAYVDTCDNSGAKTVKIYSVFGHKTRKGQKPAAGVSDLVMVAIKKGKPDVRKTVAFAIVVRQKKEYKRANGMRIKFEDNAVVILKDEKGNPKGTIFKGPIAKEVADRWPAVAKIASMIV